MSKSKSKYNNFEFKRLYHVTQFNVYQMINGIWEYLLYFFICQIA